MTRARGVIRFDTETPFIYSCAKEENEDTRSGVPTLWIPVRDLVNVGVKNRTGKTGEPNNAAKIIQKAISECKR